MISEVVGACLPLIAVRPEATNHEPREMNYRDELTGRGWYRALTLNELTPGRFLEALEQVTPRTTSQLDELAAALSERLPELVAPGGGSATLSNPGRARS
jgi:hypothetical protein